MSQFNSSAYDIQRPTGQCAVTGKVLEPLELYVATLVENPETDDLVRVDVSAEAWEAGDRPERVFSYWKAVVPEPTEKKKMFVDDGVLMNLIHRLADAEQPQRIAFRFVLTLIMMRKKLVRYDTTEYRDSAPPAKSEAEAQSDAQDSPEPAKEEWWILTEKVDLAKGPMGKWNESSQIQVMNPQLDDEGIAQVTDQLNEILQAEL